MEREALQFFLTFLLYVHMFLCDHVRIRAYSVLCAETNGSGVTDSAFVSFPSYHTCREKGFFESLCPSLASDLYKAVFHTAQIFQVHHLSQS